MQKQQVLLKNATEVINILAHPIPLKNEFLDAQTTKAPRTRRTRRPHKPKGPATILTNPNVPTETTTSLKALFAEKVEN